MYLSEYCRSPEADWDNWTTFRYHLDTIPGLSTLAQNPFMLRLLTTTLPRLLTTQTTEATKIESVDVYRAFTEMWFEREMWKQLIQHRGIPPEENRVERYRKLAQNASQMMFKEGVISLHTSQLRLQPSDSALLGGLPLHQQDQVLTFIHKSIQEYFVACAWVKSLTSETPKHATTFFGSRLASDEASLLRFVAMMCDFDTHCAPLLALVLASREAHENEDTHHIAAANAITVLNSTRFSFSGMDLSGVNIKGAILDNAMLHKTNIS